MRQQTLKFRYKKRGAHIVLPVNRLDIVGETCSVIVQACTEMKDQACQTDPVLISALPQVIGPEVMTVTYVHPQALEMLPRVAKNLVQKKSGPRASTIKGSKEKGNSCGESKEALKFRCLKMCIKRRISPRWQNRIAINHRDDSRGKPRTLGWKSNRTITSLIEFFVAEYYKKREEGLPIRMSSEENTDTDDEHYNKVLNAYTNKPPEYKKLLMEKIRKEKIVKKYRLPGVTSQSPASDGSSPLFPEDNTNSDDEEVFSPMRLRSGRT